jgi:hypothetical protein
VHGRVERRGQREHRLRRRWIVRATYKVPLARRHGLHGRKATGKFGSRSARTRHAGAVKLTIRPLPGAAGTLTLAREVLVTITITFRPRRRAPEVIRFSMTVVASG